MLCLTSASKLRKALWVLPVTSSPVSLVCWLRWQSQGLTPPQWVSHPMEGSCPGDSPGSFQTLCACEIRFIALRPLRLMGDCYCSITTTTTTKRKPLPWPIKKKKGTNRDILLIKTKVLKYYLINEAVAMRKLISESRKKAKTFAKGVACDFLEGDHLPFRGKMLENRTLVTLCGCHRLC